MLIGFIGLKGGAGKTSLALTLAACAQDDGQRAMLVDVDPAGLAHSWRPEGFFGCVQWPSSELAGLTEAAMGVDVATIDVATGDLDAMLALSMVVDALAIPCLPSPLDVPPIQGENPRTGETDERKADDSEPFASLAFKIMTDPHVGRLTYFRVYSGKLDKGDQVLNTRTSNKERVGRILEMHANDRVDKDAVFTGDIAAGIGIKNTRTGDTLCDPGKPITLENLDFPEPVIHVAVEPKSKADQEKMGKALQALAEEDPTFQVRTDEETAQTIIAAMGELHLEVLVDRMMREFKVEATVGKPQVAYRETITQATVDHQYTHKKQTGGTGQFAVIQATLEPYSDGEEEYAFESQISGGAIPKEYIKPVDDGVREAMSNGVLAGFPTVNIKVTLTDGKTHDVDSSEMAFKIAGNAWFREVAPRCKPTLLEPMMAVEVVTPDDYLGDVVGDMNSRRGQVQGTEQRGQNQVVNALVPLSEMFGYSTDLRSRTQGRATYTMQFDSYQPTPANVQEEIVARVRGE